MNSQILSEHQQVSQLIEQIEADPEHKLPEGITAIIKGAYRFPAGALHGSIYYDRQKRFPDGYQVNLSKITKIEPGGIYHTLNNTYLVQMIDPKDYAELGGII